MIISLRKWLRLGRFLVLFVLFTYVLYYTFQVVSQWIVPAQRYKEPMGEAVKAFYQQDPYNGEMSVRDRLRLFYWIGE